MRKFNLVKSLTRVINNTSSPSWGKSVRGFILCLSLAIFGINEAWGNKIDISESEFSGRVSGNSVNLGGNHIAFSFGGNDVEYNSNKLNLGWIDGKADRTYFFSWPTCTVGTLTVTKIEITACGTAIASYLQLAGGEEVKAGSSSYKSISTSSITGNSCALYCRNKSSLKTTTSKFLIKSISITYTITPDAPTLGETKTKTINVNWDGSTQSTITLSDYFSTTEEAHFNPLLAGNVDPNSNFYCQNNQFYATAAGTYTINAYIAAKDNCHAQSAASSSALTVTVNRLPQTLKMQGKTILATMNEKAPTEAEKLNLDSLITEHIGNGTVSYELMSTTIPEGKYSFDGTNFYAWHYGTATFKAKAATSAQYTEVTSDEFTIMVDKITPKAPELTWYTNDGVFNPNIEFVVGDLIKAVSSIPFTLESTNPDLATIFEDGGEYYAEIQQSTTNQQVTITANFEDVNRFNPVSYTINISRKMRQTITWEDKLNYKWEGTPITVPLTATANGNISYSLSEGAGSFATLSGTNLILSDVGTAYITATAAATDDYLEAVSTKRVVMRDPQAACDPLILEPGETIDLGVNQSKTYWFTDEPRQVYFEADKGMASAVGDLVVYEYYNSDWHNIKSISPGQLEKNKFKPFTIPMSRQASGIKFATEYNSYHRHIQNVQVALAQYFEPQTDKVTITTPHGVEKSVSFNVNYSNIQDPVSVSISPASNGAKLSVSPDQIGEDCGEHGTATITITLTPGISAETLTGYNVVFNNDKDVKNVLIPIEASITKDNQTITWNPSQTTFTTLDNIQFDATASSGLAVTYTSSDESIAKMQGNTLQVIKHGQITITAHQAGSLAFNPAPDVSKVITINVSTPTIVTMPSVVNGTITYGSKLSDVALTGGSAKDDKGNAVTGHFVWTSPDEKPHGGQQQYTVRFVPDNTDMYASSAESTETLTITVNKADQTLTWNVEDPIKVKKEDGNYTLTASSTSGRAITYTLSDPTLGKIKDDKLTPLKSGDCRITAICPADNDYNVSNSIDKNLFIAGPDEIVWKYKEGDHVWAGQNLNAKGDLATAHTTVYFGKDETQWHLMVDNSTDPKTVYTASASDDVLVTISASTSGDEYYSQVSSAIHVYIDRCYQGLVWDQNFLTYLADEQGHIDETDALTAYAVDSLNRKTDLPIVYSVDNPAVAEVVGDATNGWKLHIIGAGSATLTASVAQTDIYQGVTETRKINVRKMGERCGSYALISTSEKKISDIGDNTYTFDKPGETLTFKTRKNSIFILDADVTVQGWNYRTNTWEHIDTYNLNNTDKSTKIYTINEDFRAIKMFTGADIENNKRYISDLYITQKEYIRSSVDKIDEKIYINQDFSKTFTVNYSDKPYISCTIDNDQLEILRDDDNNTCGEYGTITFTVKNKNTWLTPTTIKGNITLSTSVGDNIIIPVTIQVELGGTYKFTNKLGDGDWSNPKNWDYGGTEATSLPERMNQVQILQPVRITKEVSVYELDVETDPTEGSNGYVTIAPTGGLTIYNGGVKRISDKLTIESSREHTGYFRVVPDVVQKWAATPTATMQYASKGSLDTGANRDATWQYFGIPVKGADFTVDYITWMYEWSEPNGWIDLKSAAQPVHLKPFQGYAITQYGQPIYDFTGSLNMGKVDLNLTYTEGDGMWGDNMFANSYPSPIDVKLFTEEDVQDLDHRTIYLYNSGSWNQWNEGTQGGDWGHLTEGAGAPGTFTAIPILAATYLETEQTLIAPMQGMCIHTDQKSGATVHLDYAKHVWDAMPTGSKDDMNAPLLIPSRKKSSQKPEGVSDEAWENIQYAQARCDSIAEAHKQKVAELRHRVRLTVYGENSGVDHIYLLEKDGFTADYDNGYDAYKMFSDGLLNVYTSEDFGEMAVSASDKIEGTFIGINAGDGETYQLKVSSVIGDNLYLKDLLNGAEIPLQEGQMYMFNAVPKLKDAQRFVIIKRENQGVGTSLDGVMGGDAYIWTDNENVHIEQAAANTLVRLFSSDGKLITTTTVNGSGEINISTLPNNVYMVMLNEQTYKFVKK